MFWKTLRKEIQELKDYINPWENWLPPASVRDKRKTLIFRIEDLEGYVRRANDSYEARSAVRKRLRERDEQTIKQLEWRIRKLEKDVEGVP